MHAGWMELMLTVAGVGATVLVFALEGRRLCRMRMPARRPVSAHRLDRPDREAAHYRASGVLPPWRS